MNRLFYIIAILLFLLLNQAVAQNPYYDEYVFNHPELDWYTIETEHFKVHYHNGAERSAKVVAKIAEDIYQPITELYDWEPDGKIHFVIKDFDDVANGGAFYYENMVEILAPQMTFTLRGTHNWLRNVVTHEFAHMISLGASRKISRKVPAFYFQWMGYEKEKRPDVLYGYPNEIASYALPMTIVPMWLAEGMAQYQISDLDYDRWDTHRDMLIRTAIEANNMHTYTEMGVFGKNSLGNERTYNAGYALTRYLAHNYGEESLKTLAKAMSGKFHFSPDAGMKQITGKSGQEVYDDWKQRMLSYYNKRLSVIDQHKVEGDLIYGESIGNISPTWSPDGKSLAFCGASDSDYLTKTHLVTVNFSQPGKKPDFVEKWVNGSISWSPSGDSLVYQKKGIAKHGSYFYDLYVYDLKTKKKEKITSNFRGISPDFAPDGKSVVCVKQQDGTDNLALVDLTEQIADSFRWTYITEYKQGEGLYSPHFSPDGESIVFAKARNHGRNIMILDKSTGKIKPLIKDVGDARDPVFSPDGEYIYFSWNKTGIHNIYRMRPDGSNPEPVTNVTGGAFMPSVSIDGRLAFSRFEEDGYKIALINEPKPVPAEYMEYVDATDIAPELDNTVHNDRFVGIRQYDDTELPDLKSTPYTMDYKQMMFLPRVMIDSNKVKLGTYFTASDFLNQYNVIGGVAANTRLDLDAFAIFEYRKLDPILFLELYAFTRNIKRSIDVIEDYPEKAPVDIQFTILEADIGAQYLFFKMFPVEFRLRHQRYTSKIKDFFFQGNKWVSPSNTYFVGNSFVVNTGSVYLPVKMTTRINPTYGYRFELEYAYESNDFFDDFATDNEYGTPQEIYTKYNYNRIGIDFHKYFPNPMFDNHAMDINLIGGWIDRSVDSFFNYFAGGLPGLRGYPFYSIEGRKLMIGRFTYRLPIFTNMQKKLFHMTTNHLYLGGFVDIGNAFNEDKIDIDAMKRDYGFNIRYSGFSFFGFPTAIEWSSAYSMDQFEHEGYTYGKEWRHYVSLLFDFMDNF